MCSNQALNDCVLFWFRQKLSQGVPVDGLMIREKALQFAKELGADTKFAARNDKQ